jgi:hypothetical protein
MSTIKIPEDIFEQIMSVMGAPYVEYAPNDSDTKDYDLELNEEKIKNTILDQVFKEYFRWFPLESYQTLSVSGTFDVPFPDNYTFSAKDVRLTSRTLGYGPTTNPLVNERFMYSSGGPYGTGRYGTRNDYGFTTANIMRNIEMQSWVDRTKTFKWRILKGDRKISGFSNVSGSIEIVWAKYSNDWDDISFEQQMDVINLSQGRILQYFGYLRQQIENQDFPISLNGAVLVEHGKDLIDSVYSKWKAFTKPVIMRG